MTSKTCQTEVWHIDVKHIHKKSNQTSILLLYWDSVTGSGLQGEANAFLMSDGRTRIDSQHFCRVYVLHVLLCGLERERGREMLKLKCCFTVGCALCCFSMCLKCTHLTSTFAFMLSKKVFLRGPGPFLSLTFELYFLLQLEWDFNLFFNLT